MPASVALNVNVLLSPICETVGVKEKVFVEVLKEGYDCSRSKRRKGVLEKCIDKGNKTIKVVVQRGNIELDGQDCWELIHVGKFTRRG